MVQTRSLTAGVPSRSGARDTARGRPGRRAPAASRAPAWPVLLAFLAPAVALYTVFIVYPLFGALQYSLFDWEGTRRVAFAGWDNFADLFRTYPVDEQLRRAFAHNGVFFAGTMLVQNTVGLTFAVLLHRGRRGKRFLQAAFTTPYLVDPLVVGYLWSLLLSPTFGPVDRLLEGAGLAAFAMPWLGDSRWALPVIIGVNAWQWVGFPMLLFGAALAGIPDEYAEAAQLDGASAWQTFRQVTLPLLIPAIGVVSVLTFVGNFNVFGLVYAMTGSEGAPGGSTDVLGLLFYRQAFQQGGLNAIGHSSALAVLMFAFIFGVSLLAMRYFRRRETRLT